MSAFAFSSVSKGFDERGWYKSSVYDAGTDINRQHSLRGHSIPLHEDIPNSMRQRPDTLKGWSVSIATAGAVYGSLEVLNPLLHPMLKLTLVSACPSQVVSVEDELCLQRPRYASLVFSVVLGHADFSTLYVSRLIGGIGIEAPPSPPMNITRI